MRKAKIAKEADIAKKVKTNPKSFFSYVNSQIKTREDISNGELVYDLNLTYMTFIVGDGDNIAFMKGNSSCY